MRASRLLSILTTLQAKGRVTAQALADECEVSLRTIYRDVDALSEAGIPVYSERGSAGGYRLLDGYRTRLNGLSSAEAAALFFAGLTRQTADMGLGGVAATARIKLLAAMPEEMRAGADRMRSRFHLDAPAWFGEGERLDHLPTVADAVWRERPILIRYRSWTGEKRRRVEPLGIVLKGGAWYLVAQVEASVRTYRIARVLGLEVLEEPFVRPTAFDLERHWSESVRRLDAELYPNTATIRVSPRGKRMMESILPAYVLKRAVVGPSSADGWCNATMPAATPDHAVSDLLRFGADIEVVGPPELRARLAAAIGRLAETYREQVP
jgi:predicted DNA-binding transcriptional regulator YafY